MKRVISFLIFTVFFVFAAGSLYAQDKVVAVVNNDIITQKDLNDFLNYMRLQYSREIKGKALEEKVEAMRLDLLQRLIDDRIILAQAKIEKMEIDSGRVKDKVNEIRRRYQSDSEMDSDLAKQGLVRADLENKIREQMLMYNVVEQKVRSKIMVWPEEITSFYNQNKQQFLKSEERVVTVIIFSDEDSAKIVSYQLKVGSKLEELATKYQFITDNLTVAQGQQLRSEIEETVFKLGLREVSEPVNIDARYYVFKLDGIVGSRQLSLDEAQGRIQAYLFDKKLQDALAKWLDELKKQSYIKILDN